MTNSKIHPNPDSKLQTILLLQPMMDQMWNAQPAQAPPPHPPSAKRPADDVEPDPAPAAKRGRTSEAGFGVSPTPNAESLFPSFPGGAFPAGGHPLQGTAAIGGDRGTVAQGAPFAPVPSFAGGAFPAGGNPQQGMAAIGGAAQGAPLAPGQWAGGQFHLPGGQGPGAPMGGGKKRGVLSPGKKAGKGATPGKKKLKQGGTTVGI